MGDFRGNRQQRIPEDSGSFNRILMNILGTFSPTSKQNVSTIVSPKLNSFQCNHLTVFQKSRNLKKEKEERKKSF